LGKKPKKNPNSSILTQELESQLRFRGGENWAMKVIKNEAIKKLYAAK
jgi:hypothetical protein